MRSFFSATHRQERWLVLGAAILNLGVILSVTWGKWGQQVVDVGQTFFSPWRAFRGELIYRDFQYFYGPFVVYWHAFLYAVLGVKIQTLWFSGIASILLVCWLMYLLLRRFLGRWHAVAVVLFFQHMYAATVGWSGIFSFAQPYNHSSTYFVCAILAFAIFWYRGLARPGHYYLPLASSALVLSALMRPDFALVCAAIAFALHPRQGLRWLAVPLAGVVVFYAGLGQAAGWERFFRENLMFSGHGTGPAGIGLMTYYQIGLWPVGALWSVDAFLFMAPVVALALFPARNTKEAIATVLLVAGVCWYSFDRLPQYVSQTLPVLAVCACVRLWPKRRERPDLFFLVLVGLFLSSRIFFHSTIESYTFYAQAVSLIPVAWLGLSVRQRQFPAVVLLVAALTATAQFQNNRLRADEKKLEVQSPRGTIQLYLAPANGAFQQAVYWALNGLRAHSFVVLPDGGLFCLMTAASCPLYNVHLHTNALLSYPPSELIHRIEVVAPEYILSLNHYSPEFDRGMPSWTDTPQARAILSWVKTHYRLVRSFGSPPGTTPAYNADGAQLFERLHPPVPLL